MSNMFTNIFGKGILKKVTSFFFRGGVGTIDIGKDSNIISSITTSRGGGNSNTEDSPPVKNFNVNNPNNENKIYDEFSVYLDDNDRKKEEAEIDKTKLYPKSFNHIFSDFRNRMRERTGMSRGILRDEELIKNRLKNRVCEAVVSANSPREDRSNAIQLKNFDGYFLTVLDGHGGDEVAEYASKRLHEKFDTKYIALEDSDLNEQERVKKAIEYTFEEIEKEYYAKALEKYRSGEGKFGYVGSCALCIVVHDNHLHVANLGDCKAILFRRSIASINGMPEIFYEPIKLTTTHNARKFQEQKKLREKFPDDDIIVEKGVSCYVKGRLQPTRTLGDFYMKFKEFNQPSKNMHDRYAKRAMENFNGPYIQHTPEVSIHELTEDDEFLVLATDGLWDWLNARDVADIITLNSDNKKQIAEALWIEALNKAAYRANLGDYEKVLTLPRTVKRSIHDDISLLVVDLKNQVSYNKKVSEI